MTARPNRARIKGPKGPEILVVNNPENWSEKAKNDKWTWEHSGLFLSLLYVATIQFSPLKHFFILGFEGTVPGILLGIYSRQRDMHFGWKMTISWDFMLIKLICVAYLVLALNSFNLSEQPFQIPLTIQTTAWFYAKFILRACQIFSDFHILVDDVIKWR